MSRLLLVLLRVASVFGLLLVATYYLLASIPFSYYHFLQFAHFWWLPVFIRFHPLVMLAAVAGLLITLRDLEPSLKRWVRYLAIAEGTATASMAATLWVPALQTYEYAALMSFAPIVAIGVAGWLDVIGHRGVIARASARNDDNRWLVGSAALAGALTASIYLVRGALAHQSGTASLQLTEVIAAAGATVAGHVIVFVLAVLAVVAARAAGARWGRTPWWEVVGAGLTAAALAALLIDRSILSALVLGPLRAAVLAALLGAAIVVTWQALLVRRRLASGAPVGTLRLALVPIARGSEWRWPLLTTSAAIIALCVAALPRLLLLADWGQTLQKLVVFLAWAASFALTLALPDRRGARRALAGAVTIFLAVVVAQRVVLTRGRQSAEAMNAGPLDLALAVERYTTFDMSLTVVLDLVRPVLTDGEFFSALRREGDVTDDRALRAVPLRLTDAIPAPSVRPPNIFLIVVDSLRPDYLSAYNSAVTFTPAIGAFARESIVMRLAFTPYAGTALSEPALWAGALIPRAMYVKPFSTVNNLERLIAAAGYRRYISLDEILTTILEDRSNLVRLDAALDHPERREQMFKFDLCNTLRELEARLDADARDPRPVFFYSQPQNLHIRVIAGDDYPRYEGLRIGSAEFFRPAAVALGRLDECFGTFVDFLKARQLYEDSIIVLTSDHGDSYGEEGRWGHAFYTVPDTVRIPLIMHLPERLRRSKSFAPDAPAMLTDLTPTLYDLLGYPPAAHNELAGRSLVTSTSSGEATAFLIQSSYSRIFGLLDPRGEWLYTASANQLTEQWFDLRSHGVLRSLTPADRVKFRRWLLERIAQLNAYYGAH